MHYEPNECGGSTNHSEEITELRVQAFRLNELMRLDGDKPTPEHRFEEICLELASDLLELHDRTGISLDKWASARTFVEHFLHTEILENHI